MALKRKSNYDDGFSELGVVGAWHQTHGEDTSEHTIGNKR